jgi:hypothetical protein
MADGDNPFGGRITLGIVGFMMLGIGVGGFGMTVMDPLMGGLGTYALLGLFVLGGGVILAAAIVNPDSLDIREDQSLDDAELRERAIDDEP